jgi:hypothetical protein
MEETTEKKEGEWIKILGILLVILFILYKAEAYFGWIGYRETWTICIDYMKQGVFWSGQPHCEGALLPFYIIATLDALVGREYVQIATIIFSTIISIVFFQLFWKAVQRENLSQKIFLPALLFGLLFYINSVTNLEAVLNSFFFFCAYYLLFYSEHKWKYYGAGVVLFFSIISKINVVVQIAFLFLWYAYEKKCWYFEDKKFKIQVKKEVLWGYLQMLLPIAAGFWIATMSYEYFWIYSWHVFTNQNIALSIFETLKQMIFFDITKADIIYIPTILIALLGTYLFWKEKKVYALISGPVFLLAIFLIIRAFGIQFATGVRYWSVIFPFTIFCILRLKQRWTEAPAKHVMQGILVVLLVYPGLYQGPFLLKDDLSYIDSMNIIDKATESWQEKDALIKQIHYGYSVVPAQEGRILIEDDPAGFKRKIISYGANIPYDQVDFLTKKYMESHPDIWGFPRYQELLGENLIYETATEKLNEKEQEMITRIENGAYSLIIFGPPEWAITQKILANLNNETMKEYCQVLVPNNVWLTEGGWHYSYFFFREHEDCQELLQKMAVYFMQQYHEICTKDGATANMIRDILIQNGVAFDMMCSDGGASLEYLKTGEGIKRVEIICMIVLFALPLCYGFWKAKPEQKRTYLLMLGALGIMLLVIILFIGSEIP